MSRGSTGLPLSQVAAIMRKELACYRATPLAFRLLALFLSATCFAVFFVAGLLTRGAADVRPLFHWMPPALIFLAAGLTMRQWSEEQRSGTLQVLLALPINLWQGALGKFLAAMAVIFVALALTIPIPAAVAVLAPLEWWPLIGGYVASLLLAGAYTALGLWLSALTDDPLAAFLATALAGGLLYLAGSPPVLAGAPPACRGLLTAVGTGSRFAGAERGILDLRDLVYYGSLCSLFLLLMLHALDRKRWGDSLVSRASHRSAALRLTLAAGGLLALNLALAPLHALRVDLRRHGDAMRQLTAPGEAQALTCEVLACALILAGLVGIGAAARAWGRRERTLELNERDAYMETGPIG